MVTTSLQNKEEARSRRSTTSRKSNSLIRLTFIILAGFIVYQTLVSVVEIIG